MTDKVTLGKLGEALFIKLFGGVQSDDEYDRIKDVVLDGRNVEIKVQNRHISKNMFTIRDAYYSNGRCLGVDNIIKCFNVDRLIFIEYDSSDTIKIWECPRTRTYTRFTTQSNTSMIGFHIGQMTLLRELLDSAFASECRVLTQSSLFK